MTRVEQRMTALGWKCVPLETIVDGMALEVQENKLKEYGMRYRVEADKQRSIVCLYVKRETY